MNWRYFLDEIRLYSETEPKKLPDGKLRIIAEHCPLALDLISGLQPLCRPARNSDIIDLALANLPKIRSIGARSDRLNDCLFYMRRISLVNCPELECVQWRSILALHELFISRCPKLALKNLSSSVFDICFEDAKGYPKLPLEFPCSLRKLQLRLEERSVPSSILDLTRLVDLSLYTKNPISFNLGVLTSLQKLNLVIPNRDANFYVPQFGNQLQELGLFTQQRSTVPGSIALRCNRLQKFCVLLKTEKDVFLQRTPAVLTRMTLKEIAARAVILLIS
jgi:hypothetical protein